MCLWWSLSLRLLSILRKAICNWSFVCILFTESEKSQTQWLVAENITWIKLITSSVIDAVIPVSTFYLVNKVQPDSLFDFYACFHRTLKLTSFFMNSVQVLAMLFLKYVPKLLHINYLDQWWMANGPSANSSQRENFPRSGFELESPRSVYLLNWMDVRGVNFNTCRSST